MKIKSELLFLMLLIAVSVLGLMVSAALTLILQEESLQAVALYVVIILAVFISGIASYKQYRDSIKSGIGRFHAFISGEREAQYFQILLQILKKDPKTTHTLEIQPRIRKPPGTTLLSLVEFLYSPKTVEGVFRPIIADWQKEYFDALNANHTIKARWISVRYRYSFVVAMGVSKVYSLFRNILSARK